MDPIEIRAAMLFENPKAFQESLRVIGVGWIELLRPRVELGDDLVGVPAAQFQSSAVTRAVLFRKECVAYFLNRFPLELYRLERRFAFRRDTVDTAMLSVPVRVPHVVLHVPDDRVGPIGDIERTVATDLDVGRAEVWIARDEDRLDFLGGDIRSVVFDFMLENTEEADAIADQEVALVLFREQAAG